MAREDCRHVVVHDVAVRCAALHRLPPHLGLQPCDLGRDHGLADRRGMGAHGAETDESDPHPIFSWFVHGPLSLPACALIGVRRAGKVVSGNEHAAFHQAACGAVHGEAGKAGRVGGGEIDRDLGDA